MFKIFAAWFLIIFTVAVPPLAILTIPIAIIWASRVTDRRHEERRVLSIYEAHQEQQARLKILRSW